MEWSEIVSFGFQTIITVIIGACAWGIKNAIGELKEKTLKNANDIKELSKDLNDLKSDLPLVYVLREDFIRALNNVDKSLSNIGEKIDKLMATKKE